MPGTRITGRNFVAIDIIDYSEIGGPEEEEKAILELLGQVNSAISSYECDADVQLTGDGCIISFAENTDIATLTDILVALRSKAESQEISPVRIAVAGGTYTKIDPPLVPSNQLFGGSGVVKAVRILEYCDANDIIICSSVASIIRNAGSARAISSDSMSIPIKHGGVTSVHVLRDENCSDPPTLTKFEDLARRVWTLISAFSLTATEVSQVLGISRAAVSSAYLFGKDRGIGPLRLEKKAIVKRKKWSEVP